MKRTSGRTSHNKLLASLPLADYERLRPFLNPISFSLGHVILKPGETLRRIYFPGEGVCSITQVMRNGRTVEVATVETRDSSGINSLFRGDRWLAGAVVKVPDGATQAMSLSAVRREMRRRGAFARVANRYAQGFVAFLMQSVACNALHSVDERCARWLLTTRDRAGRNEFPLTQEFFAAMLGVRRATVRLVIGELQRAGLIDFGPSRIVILDRTGLESVSCECYIVLRRLFARLLS